MEYLTTDTGLDLKMEITNDNHMEGVEMETEKQNTKDEMHQHLKVSDGSDSSCRTVRVRSRPTLLSTKSFPPYSQCIGGLGEDEDIEFNPESSDVMRKDSNCVAQGTTSNEGFELKARCARGEVKAKWKMRGKERLGGSAEVDTEGWERVRWSGIRSIEEAGREIECKDKRREGSTNREWKHWRGRNSIFEKERKEDDGERKRYPVSAAEAKSEWSKKTSEWRDEEVKELHGEDSTTHQWSSPHPIFSKLLHSSSSSCSSINFSSAESDEVFSEGEDVASKRRAFRKSRSWKTYLTMMCSSLQQQSSWVQLAGHKGNLQLSDGGEVLKLFSEVEAKCLDCLMRDSLRPFVPQYHGLVTRGEHCYIRLEDLLKGLKRPVIMDCKMGVRTYQEEELVKARTIATLRSDMYQKMVKIDPSAPTAEEHIQKGVTKCRYLQWRDTTSSTSTLGFRIEGIMMEDGSVQRDFRKTLELAQVTEALLYFTRSHLDILKVYHSRLLALSDALNNSQFFRTHEVIGSSLLFVHDHSSKASVWMIDFGKTTPVPDTNELRHNVPWAEGSREDGYLIGLTSLITCLKQAISVTSRQQEDSCGQEESAA